MICDIYIRWLFHNPIKLPLLHCKTITNVIHIIDARSHEATHAHAPPPDKNTKCSWWAHHTDVSLSLWRVTGRKWNPLSFLHILDSYYMHRLRINIFTYHWIKKTRNHHTYDVLHRYDRFQEVKSFFQIDFTCFNRQRLSATVSFLLWLHGHKT